MTKILRDDIEYIIHCEQDWTIIWPISKLHAHLPWVREILTHRCTRSMVYNYKLQKYWLQYKKAKVYDEAQRDMWVAWHNCYIRENNTRRMTDFPETLQKEAKEEVGLDLNLCYDLESFLSIAKTIQIGSVWYVFEQVLIKNQKNSERIGMSLIVTDEENLHFLDWEVIWFEWYTIEELHAKMPTLQKSLSLEYAFDHVEKFRKEYRIF